MCRYRVTAVEPKAMWVCKRKRAAQSDSAELKNINWSNVGAYISLSKLPNQFVKATLVHAWHRHHAPVFSIFRTLAYIPHIARIDLSKCISRLVGARPDPSGQVQQC